MTSRARYPTDLSDAQWLLIEPVLAAWRAPRLAASACGDGCVVHDLREIMNAILYVARAGCAWALLPHDLPPYKTVYDYFAKWRDDGTIEAIHDLLREKVRASHGRATTPSVVIIDSQSVKTGNTANSDTVGYDPAKKIKGRKRHIAVDTLGLLVVLGLSAACVHDSPAGARILEHVAAVAPGVTSAFVDGGYGTQTVDHGTRLGIDVTIVRRPAGSKCFRILPKRWIVERTFGWFMLHRRLARDYETHLTTARVMILTAMTGVITRTLTRQNTPTWRTLATTKTDN